MEQEEVYKEISDISSKPLHSLYFLFNHADLCHAILTTFEFHYFLNFLSFSFFTFPSLCMSLCLFQIYFFHSSPNKLREWDVTESEDGKACDTIIHQ